MELSSRFGVGKGNVNLFGIIKEVGVDTEGLLEFQTKYFNNNELYLDSNKEFYKALGNKSLLSQPWSSWNPFTLYGDFNKLMARMKEKKIEGNLKGEGLLKGGLIIVSPTKGIVYKHEESTGIAMPYAEIEKVITELTGVAVNYEGPPAGSGEFAVCMSKESCGDS